jgi:AcrR family transcriptional regulator
VSAARRVKKQKSPQAAARDAFRDSVRRAAERACVAKGFRSLKMVDIAAEAGVGVGTIYNYFADKQAVFTAIFEARTEEFEALLDRATTELSPCAQIEACIRTSLKYFEENEGLIMLFCERGAIGELDIERLGGEVMEQGYERFLRRLESILAAAVAEGELRSDVPLSALVAAVSGARNGMVYAWIKSRRRERLSQLADHCLSLFFLGARPRHD